MTLNEVLGTPLRGVTPVYGGDINDAYKLTLSDGRQVFMKANRSAGLSFFQAVGRDQQYGPFLLLEWVETVPNDPDFWESFGRSLARMHQAPASRFGWEKDNYIGASPQINTPHDNWIAFYRDCRLAPQFKRAQRYFDPSMHKRITRLLDHLEENLVEPPHPSLLHGDRSCDDGVVWRVRACLLFSLSGSQSPPAGI